VTRVQNRAYDKLKMAAALLGGNLVYVKNASVEGNIRSSSGGRTSRAQITGTVYCSDLLDANKFKKILENDKEFQTVSEIRLGNNDAQLKFSYDTPIKGKIASYSVDKGFIFLSLKLKQKLSNVKYRVIRFDDSFVTVAYREGTSIYNLTFHLL